MIDQAAIRVILVDDHRIVREGIGTLLRDSPQISVIETASDGNEALKQLELQVPDVLITDLNMPDLKGIDFIKTVRQKYPQLKILVLTMHTEYHLVEDALSQGVLGYVQKDIGKLDLIRAIKSVNEGGTYLSKEVQQVLEDTEAKNKSSRFKELTNRETEILKLIVQGLSSPAIADKLSISTRTVENHRLHILHKLKVKNTVELVRYALDHHLA